MNLRQHLLWQQDCVFGKDYFGDLQCLSSIFSQIITFMPFERLWMELVVVRINWKHFLAIVPIINDGNIYGTKNVNFWDTLLHFLPKYL